MLAYAAILVAGHAQHNLLIRKKPPESMRLLFMHRHVHAPSNVVNGRAGSLIV
jgi:hypothetical protein